MTTRARLMIMRKRHILFDLQHGLCYYCQQPVNASNQTIDHIVPRSKGGTYAWSNLVGACLRCNQKKCNKSLGEFYANRR